MLLEVSVIGSSIFGPILTVKHHNENIFEYGPALGVESFDIRVPSPDKVQTFLAHLCYSHLRVSNTY